MVERLERVRHRAYDLQKRWLLGRFVLLQQTELALGASLRLWERHRGER